MNPLKRFTDYITSKSYEVLFYDKNEDLDSKKHWSKADFLNANEISLYTNRAIAKRAEKVAEIDFVLTKQNGDVEENHPLLSLLHRPNDLQTGRQFWALYQTYKDLTGCTYIWKEPKSPDFTSGNNFDVKALHLLRPDYVTIRYDSDGNISEFVYSTPWGKRLTFPPEQIIYSYNPDPKKPTEGLSLLQGGIRSIDTEVQLNKYHANVLRNGGKVESVVKFKSPNLNKQQAKELREQYEEQFAESRNSGKPMFLGGDAEVLNMGLNPSELSFLETKGVILNDIAIMTGVPKTVLGVPTGETFANSQAAISIFLRETIKPLLTDLAETLNWRLVPDELTLDYVDPTPEDKDMKLKETESGVKNYYMTINEARERHDLEPIDGGDQILAPLNVVPLENVEEQPEEPADPPEAPDEEDEDEQRTAPKTHPLRDKFVRERYHKLMVKRMDRDEQKVLDEIERYFADQKRRIVEYIDGGTRVYRRKDLIEDAFDKEVELNLAKQTLLPLIRSILQRSGENAIEFVGSSSQFVLSAQMESWLDQRSALFAESVTNTTFETLKDQFSQSLEAGEGRQALVRRIGETYAGFTENRARTIARTEVHGATQQGTFEGYKQAGLKTKIWVATFQNTRDSHAVLDGEEVPMDKPFQTINGYSLMYPGDGPPEESVNCQCSI